MGSFSLLYMQIIAICGARNRPTYPAKPSWLDNVLLYGKRALSDGCRAAHSFSSPSDSQSPALTAIIQSVRI